MLREAVPIALHLILEEKSRTGDIRLRSTEICDNSRRDCITADSHDNWDTGGGSFGNLCPGCSVGYKNIDIETYQICH
jgi:hypothetical protein